MMVPKPEEEVGIREGKGEMEDGEEDELSTMEDVGWKMEDGSIDGEGEEARLAVLGWRLPEKKK